MAFEPLSPDTCNELRKVIAGCLRPPIFRAVMIGGAAALLAGCATNLVHRKAAAALPAWKIPAPAVFLAETPAPPRPGSATVRRQIAEIIDLQARATAEKLACARWTYDFSVFTFGLAIGPGFTAEHYPKTAAFFAGLNDLVQFVNDDLKNAFKAPHPFQVSPRVKRFVDAVPGYDYPSYHSARCAVFRRVLAQLDPARAAAFQAVSDQVVADRVFAGEHFPFSIAAGNRLGEKIFAELEKDPAFRAAVTRLRQAEWTPAPDARDSFQRQ